MSPPLSVCAVLLEQTERTRHSSRSDIARFLEESELKITSLEFQTSTPAERACVAALKHILAPIHILPVELLAAIFELAIGDDTHIKDAYRLSQVCENWRQVAHGTPQLWTRRLQIDLKSGYSKVYADGLKAWLARSVPLPIHISLMLRSTDINPRMLEDVLSIAPRCRCLELGQGRFPLPPHLISQLFQSRLDILEQLDLWEIHDIGVVDRGIDLIAIPRPRLRTLRICIGSNSSQILMPWSQLTDLSLFVKAPNIALDILSYCANLIRASISTPRSGDKLLRERNIHALTYLHTLSVTLFGVDEHITPFLDFISAPVLRELQMHYTLGHWTEAHFTAFQLRAPPITRLEISSANITSDDLRAAILHAPSLTHLEILFCDHSFDDALIRALHYKDGVTPLVPCMHHFVFRPHKHEFTQDILAAMIISRWCTDTKLASHVGTPIVARWTHVELQGFDQHFFDMLKELPSNVLVGC
ncbi:hypothetical protein K438DRAFT_275591 [Mycena galopus ATCC 62051]|nr:hypothetical protein K438DRAFT_275591 [Mycena galopus ATCC 62051]